MAPASLTGVITGELLDGLHTKALSLAATVEIWA